MGTVVITMSAASRVNPVETMGSALERIVTELLAALGMTIEDLSGAERDTLIILGRDELDLLRCLAGLIARSR